MYSSFSFQVTDLLDYSQPHVPVNLLTVKLDPPPKNQQNFAGMKHNFSGDYLTGLIPFGIWQPVKLVATNRLRLENYRVEYDLHKNAATAVFYIELSNLSDSVLEAELNVSMTGQDQQITHSEPLSVSPGTSVCTFSFEIEDPQLWWPYELGEPFLYDLNILIADGKSILDSLSDKTGIRTITMQMNPGFTEEESRIPWTFVINGKPMFLRSACWGGQPSFFYGRNSTPNTECF